MHQGKVMKQKVSSKLLVLFGITCGIFFFAQQGFCATSAANKSSSFSTKMSKTTPKSSSKKSDSALAEQIRAQRASLDTHDAQTTNAQSAASVKNNCDATLRKCIESKCNSDYSKCATDSEITFSDKLTACKQDANCSAHEFTLFVNEIKEDKKQEILLSEYNKVINCGNSYNDCIIKECGQKFNKCLGKSAGDKAIAACKKIATECTEADSGMVGRIGNIFGTVRQDAEVQIKADEKKLYSLRDQLRNASKTLGALFDDRSLDCIFTANFFAGDDQIHPKASKKLYAGSMFDCTPDWFGIDVTTFKENAYRATRAQSAASAAMLGSGLGTAVGAITSGAIDRAIDRQKAENALEDACEENGQEMKDGKCVDKSPEDKCEDSGGKYTNKHCICSGELKEQDGACVDKDASELCKDSGGEPQSDGSCKCKSDTKRDVDGVCVDKKAKEQCDEKKGKLTRGECKCPTKIQDFKGTKGECVVVQELVNKYTEVCTHSAEGATWDNNECKCPEGQKANDD